MVHPIVKSFHINENAGIQLHIYRNEAVNLQLPLHIPINYLVMEFRIIYLLAGVVIFQIITNIQNKCQIYKLIGSPMPVNLEIRLGRCPTVRAFGMRPDANS